MKKKTGKLVYVLLGIGVLLSIALVPFAIKRKSDFSAEGDQAMVDLSVKMEVFGAVCAIVFVGIILFLLLRDRRIEADRKLFCQELSKTPLFGRWLRGEEEQFKKKLSGPRRMLTFLSIPMIAMTAVTLIVSLDTMGDIAPFQAAAYVFMLFVICFVRWFSDYRKQYMRSLLRSVSEQLPSAAEKEAFADQLMNGRAGSFAYCAAPQTGASTAYVTEAYLYFRQFRKCGILRNRDIGGAALKKEWFTLGLRPHFRRCYVLELSINGTKRPWRGYFGTQEELFYALGALKKGGLSEEKVENRING